MRIGHLIILFSVVFIFFGAQRPECIAVKSGRYVVKFRLYDETFVDTVSVSNVDICQPVALLQYKEFLKTVNASERSSYLPDYRVINDNGKPDANNAISWDIYFNSGQFDKYPVVGITWENAVSYCQWLNQKENTKDKEYEYRLPYLNELLIYFQHFEKKRILTHRNEWTVNAYDESMLLSILKKESYSYTYSYDAQPEDSPALKRKAIVYRPNSGGKMNLIHCNYQYQSNEFTSFRIVKEYKK